MEIKLSYSQIWYNKMTNFIFFCGHCSKLWIFQFNSYLLVVGTPLQTKQKCYLSYYAYFFVKLCVFLSYYTLLSACIFRAIFDVGTAIWAWVEEKNENMRKIWSLSLSFSLSSALSFSLQTCFEQLFLFAIFRRFCIYICI